MAYEQRDNFWRHVNKTETCWLWTGAQTRGYGQCTINKLHGYAHRFSYEMTFGEIPYGNLVCHSCDVPLCVRPEHLFLGTQLDNVSDGIRKGRFRTGTSKGSKNGSSKLKEDDIIHILSIRKTGLTSRQIAKIKNVSKSTICYILNGSSWRHVDDIRA